MTHPPGYRPDPWGTAGDHERRVRALEATVGGGAGGIQFDVKPQTGSFLEAETTGGGYPVDDGITSFHLKDSGGGGIYINEDAGGGILIRAGSTTAGIPGGGGLQLVASYGGVSVIGDGTTVTVDSDQLMTLNGAAGIDIRAVTDVEIEATGDLILTALPITDPAVTNAIWADSGVLVQSGHTVPGASGIAFGVANVGTYLDVAVTAGDISFKLDAAGYLLAKDSGGATLLSLRETGDSFLNLGSGQAFQIKDSSATVIASVDDSGNPYFQVGSGGEFDIYDSSGGQRVFAVYDDGSVHILTGTSIVADL